MDRIYNDVTDALPDLLNTLLVSGATVGSRNGRTRELRHIGITLEKPWRREVLTPGRKCNIAAQIAETVWVLAGRNDVEWLAHYLPRALDYSDDGKTWRGGYGPRLRNFHGVDQLDHVINLLRENPDTRRAVATIYDPQLDSTPSKDIPCNNWLSFLIRDGKLDLHVAVRSNDAMWGWSGINTFEWSVLQEIVAELVGVEIGGLHFSVTSFHIYEKHWERAAEIVKESQRTERVLARESPRFDRQGVNLGVLDAMLARWFACEEEIRLGRPDRLRIDLFPEPMLRSWLRVLDWWWNGTPADRPGHQDGGNLPNALAVACAMGVTPPWKATPAPVRLGSHPEHVPSDFLVHAIRTHNDKHAAYGDSWKRRGEMLGIMANIARKIDRLGGPDTADETSADTAMDLMIYLAKYRVWLGADHVDNCSADPTATPDAANELLVQVEKSWEFVEGWSPALAEPVLKESFERLERKVVTNDSTRYQLVDSMLHESYRLARRLFDDLNIDQYLGADHE
jgi:thymidylate synthase